MKSDNCYRTSNSCGKPDVVRHPHFSSSVVAPDVIKPNNHTTSEHSHSRTFESSLCDSNYLTLSPTREKVENAGASIAIGPSKGGKEYSS